MKTFFDICQFEFWRCFMSIFEFLIETLHYKSKLYLTTGLTVLIGEAHFLFDNMMLLQNFIHVQVFWQVTCSWHQKTNFPIHKFKCCIKAKEPFKTPFNGVLVLIYCFKRYFKPCFFLMTFFTTLNRRIGEFVFDVKGLLVFRWQRGH